MHSRPSGDPGKSLVLRGSHKTLHPHTRNLPLVSREWKNGSNSSYNCTPFLHSLLTKGKENHPTTQLAPTFGFGNA